MIRWWDHRINTPTWTTSRLLPVSKHQMSRGLLLREMKGGDQNERKRWLLDLKCWWLLKMHHTKKEGIDDNLNNFEMFPVSTFLNFVMLPDPCFPAFTNGPPCHHTYQYHTWEPNTLPFSCEKGNFLSKKWFCKCQTKQGSPKGSREYTYYIWHVRRTST